MRAKRSIGIFFAGCAAAALSAALGLSLVAGTAKAQAVVQPLPSLDSQRLAQALARLGKDPRDVGALIDAGDSASGLGDYDAAIGFYQRADQISSGNPRIKAGLAKAMVLSGDPVGSLPMFADAERVGASASSIASSRGLAYDLVGDNLTAQRYYKAVLGGTDDTEVRLRLALSQAISGDAPSSEATLMPLLRKQDKAGWRTRAFALAVGGDTKQAVDITNSMLPPRLAESIAPYLRYMPRLTPAQQASAANLGKFPRASEIGHDDPKIAVWVAAHPVARVATADLGLIPKGEPLGKKGKKAKAGMPAVATTDKPSPIAAASTSGTKPIKVVGLDTPRVAPPEPKPTIERSDDGELPPLVASAAPTESASMSATVSARPGQAASTTTSPVSTATRSPNPALTPAPTGASARAAVAAETAKTVRSPAPGFDLANLPSSQTLAGSPVVSAQPQVNTATSVAKVISAPPSVPTAVPPAISPALSPVLAVSAAATPSTAETPDLVKSRPLAPEPDHAASLFEIFADFGKPETQAEPKAGAVDISKIEPTKPEPKPIIVQAKVKKPEVKAAPKKPAPPSHPSRIWVQLGVGRDKAAIAFDWRRYEKQAPAAFKGMKPYTSDMNRTNRILAGPFETQKAASDFLAKLKKADVEGAIIWTSPAGQVVDALSAK